MYRLMASTKDFWETLRAIEEQYPEYMSIIKQPGVFAVFAQVVQNPAAWSPSRITAALHNTDYWKNTPSSRRQWDLLQAEDPAEAAKTAGDTQRLVRDAETATGIQLGAGFGGQEFNFFVKAVQEGWSADRIRYELLAIGGKGSGGDLAESAATVRSMANDYGVPISDAAAQKWATQLAQGAIDTNAIRGYLVEQAKSLYPGLSSALDRGITVKQYADPYLQIAQQELGTDPNTISLLDPKWQKALNQIDPKTGARTSMSLSDWTSLVRTDPAYGYDHTPQGAGQATQLATALSKSFGTI